jgi:hypothetical protein
VRGISLNHNAKRDYNIGTGVDCILSAKWKLEGARHAPDFILGVAG